MELAALDPPPAALEPDAPPPWPEPTGKLAEPELPQEGAGCGSIAIAIPFVIMALFSLIEKNYAFTKIAVGIAVLLVGFGLFMLRRAKAYLPARRARIARLRPCWARVKSSKVKSERKQRGALTHYVLDLDLEIWEPSPRATPHRTAPHATAATIEAVVPSALGPHVLPGAFFAVAVDPIDRGIIPFTLLTRDGAQFPV